MRWIDLAQDREQWKALMNAGSIKCWEILEYMRQLAFTQKGFSTMI
jgi:hypothetical protein